MDKSLELGKMVNSNQTASYRALAQITRSVPIRVNFTKMTFDGANNVIIEIDSLLKKLKRRNIAKKSWEKFGAVIIVEKISDGIELINKLAPEHLEIALDNAKEYLKDIKNAGAIFLGKFTPEAIGDYIAGPNHVLPTDRTARFTSGLNLLDYFKRSSVVSCTEKSIKKIGLDAINIANEEGLQAHALSIECRIKK